MSSIKQKAILYNGRSQKCHICPLKMGKCTPEIMRVCSDSFIEGFIKGTIFIKKQIKEKKK